jgi:four helix bundle protein
MIPLARVRSYRDLVVWQRAMDLAVWVHLLSRTLPRTYYRLADQMQRAATSVASNIAEGSGRNRAREYAHFAAIARGSVREVETQLLLGLCLGLIRRGDVVEPLEFGDQINRMLTALIKRLR